MLDTHIAIWLTVSPDTLRPLERAVLARRDHKLLLSTIAIWEVRMKWEAVERRGLPHRIPSPMDVVALASGYSIEVVGLTVADHLASLRVPIAHNDPFDAMMLVHTQQLGAKLLTRDGKLRAHPLSLPL